MRSEQTISRRATVVKRTEARHYGHCRPSCTDLSGFMGCVGDALADVDAFVDAVLDELAAMATDGTRPQRPGPKPPLAGAALRKAVMAIWCACFCGMPWRAVGLLCDIPFNTLYGLFARWTRLGL